MNTNIKYEANPKYKAYKKPPPAIAFLPHTSEPNGILTGWFVLILLSVINYFIINASLICFAILLFFFIPLLNITFNPNKYVRCKKNILHEYFFAYFSNTECVNSNPNIVGIGDVELDTLPELLKPAFKQQLVVFKELVVKIEDIDNILKRLGEHRYKLQGSTSPVIIEAIRRVDEKTNELVEIKKQLETKFNEFFESTHNIKKEAVSLTQLQELFKIEKTLVQADEVINYGKEIIERINNFTDFQRKNLKEISTLLETKQYASTTN